MNTMRNRGLETATLKFFNHAQSFDTNDLFMSAGQPTLANLSGAVANFVRDDAVEQGVITKMQSIETRELFHEAISNTQTIFSQHLLAAGVPLEQLPVIARHPETSRAIAALALRGNQAFDTILRPHAVNRYVTVGDSHDYMTTTDALEIPPSGGCPFASSESRAIRPTKAFEKSITLTADLMHIAHTTHDAT